MSLQSNLPGYPGLHAWGIAVQPQLCVCTLGGGVSHDLGTQLLRSNWGQIYRLCRPFIFLKDAGWSRGDREGGGADVHRPITGTCGPSTFSP